MLSLKLKHFAKSRANYLPRSQLFVIFSCYTNTSNPTSSSSSSSFSFSSPNNNFTAAWLTSRSGNTSQVNDNNIWCPEAKDMVVSSFKEWFKSGNDALFDEIFTILRCTYGENDVSSHISRDLALFQLGLHLSEAFVLEVLNYGYRKEDVLSCINFFEWAGRQHGFYHTRATFNAIFKIMSRSKLMSLLLEFLQNYIKRSYMYKVRFHDTLVMGYALAGKPDVALQLFGKMRFQGLDLDSFGYHVLLNALVEENCFDAVHVISKQISIRGFENGITHSIMVKGFCKQKQLSEAEDFVRGLVRDGRPLRGHVLSVLVDALCKSNKFDHARKLVEEFQDSQMVPMEQAYGVWLRCLVQAGKLDAALEFMKNKKSLDGYVPGIFSYNSLVCKLLRENRLREVFDLLMEMIECKIPPDKVTMNSALCFFCKAGMVDIALELYKLQSEFGLSPNSMVYNYLVNTLCFHGSIDEACDQLKNSIDQGCFPGSKTFSIVADALIRGGDLDKMKELVIVALGRNLMPSDITFEKLISALCKQNKVEDGYLVHGELNKTNKVATWNTYFNLISGFSRINRGGIAARLLIEMQEKGHMPTRKIFRAVICCLCGMENPEKQFSNLLNMQLSHHAPSCHMYNYFIDGATHALRPDLARKVFEMMQNSQVEPNLSSDILMLLSYLKSERISDALNFFESLRQRRKIGRKLYNVIVVNLCKANKEDCALEIMSEMREKEVIPSIECYEVLIQALSSKKRYAEAVKLINDLEKVGRHITSFIGNILLFHSLQTHEIFEAWNHLRNIKDETSDSYLFSRVIGVFCGHIRFNKPIENLEEHIEKCFPLDVYTYNMLLRRLSMEGMDQACELFSRMHKKGYKPNVWTYDILVRGFLKHGKKYEARKWFEEMVSKGFEPTEQMKQLI